MTKDQQELAWRVGGPQGSGVDTAAGIFARTAAIDGLHVYGRREYYSNITGRHSYYDIRVAYHPLTSHREAVDFLTTFEEEALARHAISTVEEGAIIYEAGVADVPLEGIPFLDDQVREDLSGYLEERDQPATTGGLIEDARSRGVHTFPVPFAQLTASLAEDLGIPQATADRTLNTVAVAVSCALLGHEPGCLNAALEKTFPGRDKIIQMNVRAAKIAYDFVHDAFQLPRFGFRLVPQETEERRIFLSGTQAVAMGKLAAGMTFQTYYPISPATDESVYLESHETFPTRNGEEGSVLVVQTEDEIAAITMASGAALTGARSATATSGPGFSLMAEGLGWAGMSEVPVVVTLYQRGGPSTGLPTRTEQGDLLFAIYASHGESSRIAFASGDITEAFYDAAEAFNYAERYQLPVIHLLDKALANTTQTLAPFEVDKVRIERGEIYDAEAGRDGSDSFPRYAVTASGVSPRPLLGQPGGTHWSTGGEHTMVGRVTEDPGVREQQMEKRARKLDLAAREIPKDQKLRVHGNTKAPFTVVSWGSNKGGILEALDLLDKEGISARLVQVRLLWPFPTQEIGPLLETANPLVIVESNFSGQFAHLLRQQTGREADHLVVKYNGRPMSGRELHRALRQIHEGPVDRKVVLRNPFE